MTSFSPGRIAGGHNDNESILWAPAGIDPGTQVVVAACAGMAETLRIASERGAFALSDRSQFLCYRSELDLKTAFEGNGDLRNIHSVLLPARAGRASLEVGHELAQFFVSPEGRSLIARCEAHGQPLFAPAA